MTTIRAITRISPVNMWSNEVFSKLTSPEAFGKPCKIEVCFVNDPHSGLQYRMETTFIFENIDSSNQDSSMALKCKQVPGLIPATPGDSMPDIPNQKSCLYFLNVPETLKSKTVHSIFGSNTESETVASKLVDLKDTGYKPKNIKVSDINKKLLEPLMQYFTENECLICGYISLYESEQNSIKHMATHMRGDTYSCDCCRIPFQSASELYKHKIDRAKKKPYVCEVCDKKFKRNYFLTTHIRTDHAAPSTSSHSSSSKPKVSSTKDYETEPSFLNEALQSNPKSNHSPGTNLPKAKKESKSDHSPSKGKGGEIITPSFACAICKKKFHSLSSIPDHRRCHAGIERFKCLICSKHFFKSSVLKHHHHYFKGTPKSFKCRICKKMFSSANSLEEHKKLHKKQQLFSCSNCSEKFYLQSKLLEHNKTVHHTA